MQLKTGNSELLYFNKLYFNNVRYWFYINSIKMIFVNMYYKEMI